jgi:Holliday junction resolvase RusA-like endonuclease
MRYCVSFFINDLPLLPNRLNTMHWAERGKDRKKWHALVGAALVGKKPQKPLTRAVVTLVRYSSVRPDNDNLTASFKPVIDGLKVCGVIVNDDPKTLEMVTPLWEFAAPKSGKIFVRVEERTKESACITAVTNEGEMK